MSNNSSNRLMKTSAIYFVGNFASKILSFLLVPIYTSMLTTAEYGAIDLIITLNGVLAPIVSLQATQGMFRYLMETEDRNERAKIIGSSFFVIIAGSLLLPLVMIPYAVITQKFVWIIASFYIGSGIINSYVVQCTRGLHKNVLYATNSLVASGIQIGLNILFIVGLSYGNISLLLAPMIANTVSTIFLLLHQKAYKYFIVKKIDKKILKDVLKFSVPTIPSTLIWWCMTGFSKIFLSYVWGGGSLGVFSMSSKIADIILAVYSVFNLAWTEVTYASFSDSNRDEYYSAVFKKMTLFVTSLVIVAIPLSKIVAPFIFKNEFIQATQYIPVMLLVCVFNIGANFLSTIFQAFKETKYVLWARIPGAAVNIILNLILTPTYGIWGTAVSLLSAMAVDFAMSYVYSAKFVKMYPDRMFCLQLPILAAVIVIYYIGNTVLLYVGAALALTAFIAFNYKLILSVFKQALSIIKKKEN